MRRHPFPAPGVHQTADSTLQAVMLICGYALIIGFIDNYVRVIANEHGLWQFHATRTLMALVLLIPAVPLFGLRLRPVRPWAVAARSMVHGGAMLIYFGALGFLPVAVVAAGLFTAPVFVLLISRFAYGHAIGPVRILAVLVGFAGAMMVLGPEALAGASYTALLPVAAGALYAIGNLATRQWCTGESAETLVTGFFLALGVFGVLGMGALLVWPAEVTPGPSGFVLRGVAAPTITFLGLTLLQAVGSLLGVGMMIRAYQLTDAGRASVIEYTILPASAVWSWLIWGEGLAGLAIIGMTLIIGAGAVIALQARVREKV
jgi:drug/metabolite transporter (DMT)-like permease